MPLKTIFVNGEEHQVEVREHTSFDVMVEELGKKKVLEIVNRHLALTAKQEAYARIIKHGRIS